MTTGLRNVVADLKSARLIMIHRMIGGFEIRHYEGTSMNRYESTNTVNNSLTKML